jgi:membrane protease YdiL (CAAX protease family)
MSAYHLGSIIGEVLRVNIFGVNIAAGMVEWGFLLGAVAFILNVILSSAGYRSIGFRTRDFLSSVISGPIIEEIIFRLVLISAFTIFFNSVLIAVIASSFLFAIGHILWGGFTFIDSFVDGLIWGWAFLTLGIGVPIIAHILHNFLVFVTNSAK